MSGVLLSSTFFDKCLLTLLSAITEAVMFLLETKKSITTLSFDVCTLNSFVKGEQRGGGWGEMVDVFAASVSSSRYISS